VVVEHANRANAFARARTQEIVLTTRMMTEFRDPSEAAFVLAHELAHLSLGHTNSTSEAAEFEADRLASSILTNSGYDICAGITFLERLGARVPATGRAVSSRVETLRTQFSAECPGDSVYRADKSEFL